MGLLSLLKKLGAQENGIRVLVLGLENSGKSSLVNSFINLLNNQNEKDVEFKASPTMGVEIQKMEFKKFIITFWDVGGSNSSKPYWQNYFDSINIVMWVIDSSDTEKFEESKNELESILLNDKLANASLIVVANKQDAENAAPFPDFIRDLQININQHQWTVIAAANIGEKKEVLRDELEKCLEWIIYDFSSKKSNNHE